MNSPRFAFAGDRQIAVRVLEWLSNRGDTPAALILPDAAAASHDEALLDLYRPTAADPVVLRAAELDCAPTITRLRSLALDLIVCVHFPAIVRPSVLAIPRIGALNLHPALLPHNRGWHTPTWAILDGTPAGATLHFMTGDLDRGDIVFQQPEPIWPWDTAHALYARLIDREFEVFREGWTRLLEGVATRTPQPDGGFEAHRKADLVRRGVQAIDLDERVVAGDLLRRLRALTTSRVDEAAYFVADGRKYRVQLVITPEP